MALADITEFSLQELRAAYNGQHFIQTSSDQSISVRYRWKSEEVVAFEATSREEAEGYVELVERTALEYRRAKEAYS